MEDQPVHVVGQVGERDLGLGAGDADGADEQAHFRLLMRAHVLDAAPNPAFGGVAAPDILRHRTALGRPAMDATDPALRLQPALVTLAAVGSVGPDVRGGVVARHHIAQHAPVVARAVSDFAPEDKAEGAADRITPRLQLAVKIGEHDVERPRGGEPLAEHTDRVRIRYRRTKVKSQETQPTQPGADQPFHGSVGDVVLRGQHQHLQHHHQFIGRSSIRGAVAIGQRGNQRRMERFKIHGPGEYLHRIAVRRKPLHMARQPEKPRLPYRSPPLHRASEAPRCPFGER